jgi:HSP20 family protein
MTAHLLPSLWGRLNRLPAETDGPGVSVPTDTTVPLVNVWEEPESFFIEAELPGVPQDQIHVNVTNGTDVVIEAQRPTEPERAAWHRCERSPGRFWRALCLPLPVEADQVEARLENGVLRLTLPKAASARPRRIAVKAE